MIKFEQFRHAPIIPLLSNREAYELMGPQSTHWDKLSRSHLLLTRNSDNGRRFNSYQVDGPDTDMYRDTFFFAFKEHDLAWTRDVTKVVLNMTKNGPINAVDFMGTGVFTAQHKGMMESLQSLTGIVKADPWDEYMNSSTLQYDKTLLREQYLNNSKYGLVVADLYEMQGWIDVYDHMKASNTSCFNVGFCRPYGPFNISHRPDLDVVRAVPSDLANGMFVIFMEFLSHMLGCMDKERFILFSQVPTLIANKGPAIVSSAEKAGFNAIATYSNPNYDYYRLTYGLAIWNGISNEEFA